MAACRQSAPRDGSTRAQWTVLVCNVVAIQTLTSLIWFQFESPGPVAELIVSLLTLDELRRLLRDIVRPA